MALGKMMTDGSDADIEVPKPLGEFVQKRAQEKPAKPEDWSWVDEARTQEKSEQTFEALKVLLATAVATPEEADREIDPFDDSGLDADEKAMLVEDINERFDEVKLLGMIEKEAKDVETSKYTVRMILDALMQNFSLTHGIEGSIAEHRLNEKVLERAELIEREANGDQEKIEIADKLRFAAGEPEMIVSPLLSSNDSITLPGQQF